MSLISQSIKDFFSKKFLTLSFAPLLVPIILLGFLVAFGGAEFHMVLETGASTGDFSFLDENAHPFLAWLLGFTATQWFLVTFFYVFGGLFAVLLSLVIAIVVIGFLTPFVVKILHKKYYSHITLSKSMSSVLTMSMSIGVFLRFLGLFLVSIPFMFIPLFNLLAINGPFFYLFHRMLLIDVGSSMMNKEEFLVFKSRNKWQLFGANFGFFMLSLIPFLGLFLQLLFVIYITHYAFSKISTCKAV